MKTYLVSQKDLVLQYYSCKVKANSKEEAIEKSINEGNWEKDDEEFIEVESTEAEEMEEEVSFHSADENNGKQSNCCGATIQLDRCGDCKEYCCPQEEER